jgi:hypothetical protein
MPQLRSAELYGPVNLVVGLPSKKVEVKAVLRRLLFGHRL